MFILGVILIPTTVRAETYTDTNGVTYTYSLYNNKTEITISSAKVPSNVTELIIPGIIDSKPVTVLGSDAFSNNSCDNLIIVTIPKEVTIIGNTYNNSYGGTFNTCNNLTTVIFEEGSNLKTIGNRAFNSCQKLENIIIPEKVEIIYNSAFGYCKGLTEIFIPEKVEKIGQYAFSNSGITKVTFTGESNLHTIEDNAFYYCTKLTTVIFERESSLIKENIIPTIGNYAFYYCSNLTEITIPSKIQVIGDYAFTQCTKLERVKFGDNSELTSIGNYAFNACSVLTEIEIPASVITIGNSAFYSCSILTTLIFKEVSELQTIGNSAFGNCKLNKVTIPKTTISIGNSAFSNCRYVKELEFEEGSILESIGTNAFSGCTELLNISELPETLKTIGDKAFQNCGKINNITLPKSIETIGNAVFAACTSLSNLEVNEENLNFISVNNVVYTKNKIELIIYPAGKVDNSFTVPNEVTTIRDGAFYGNISIVNIIFEEEGNNITYIGKEAFYNCTFLNNIKIPENLEVINQSTFYNCDALTMIEIPKNINNINQSAFNDCDGLVKVIFEGDSNLTTIGANALYSCNALIEIKIPSSVTEIGSYAFNYCSKLEKVLFEENSELKNIGSYAFSNCSILKEIKLPSRVTSIGIYAFEYCQDLIEINIPSGVKVIENRTFYNCYDLEKITFEKDSEGISNLITIETNAFYYCNLKELEIPENVTTIGSQAFYVCDELTSVTFKNNSTLTSVYETAFYGCTSLNLIAIENETEDGKYKIIDGALYDTVNKTVVLYPQKNAERTEYTVPAGTTRIGDYAFNNGTLLKINIPSSVAYIGTSSFNGKNKNLVIECRQNSRAFEYAKYYGINYIVSQFEAVISYDNTELTKEPITAIITLNEKLSDETKTKLEGENWVYTEELLKLEKVYEKNTEGVETINIVDWLGNQLNVYVSITNIDNKMPTLNIVYTPTELTRETVNVVIVANEAISKEVAIIENGEIARTEEWEHLIETTPFMLTCDFDENTNMNIKVKDLAGNYSEVTPITITNIKTEISTPEITYSPTKEEGITNKNVIAKVSFENTSEEQIEFINSADEITVEGLNAQYEFEEKGKYTIYYKDIAENQENITLEVDWLDKTNPKIEGVEDGKTYTRKVGIKVVDENLSEVTIVKDNDTTINYEEGMEIEAIGQYTITAIDAATNSSEVSFEIAKEIINVESISLNTNNVEMKPEESISLEETITPENATNKNIIWTSTNPEVATVSNGVVIAKEVGETTILATTEDGEKTAYCQVKVEKEVDLQGPTITEIKITPETWTNGNVEIEVLAEDENGLAVSPYSLDTKTWTNEKLTVTQNGKYEVQVKDVFGNVTTQEIEINNIDKTSPELKVEIANKDKVSKTKEVTITAKDTLSGLNEQNEFKYCVTDSKDLQNEEWLDYELEQTFEIGKGKTGEYYLHVKGITDNAGNETKVETTKITLDNTAPKVLVNNSEEETAHKTATIKVEEENVYEIVVMKDGQEIEYKENEILKDIGNYEIIVKDIAGNESKVRFEISEFITNEKYTTYEEEGIWYIGNISPETSKERFIENLETNITGIEIKTKEQENLLEGKYVGTGMTVVMQGIEYKLIVKGDTTGDGKANGQDALAILFHREGKLLLEGENLKAADLNEDDKVNGMDALLLLLHRERQDGYIL